MSPYRTAGIPALTSAQLAAVWHTPRQLLDLACEMAGRRRPDRALVVAIADAVELAASSVEDWTTARAARALVLAVRP